MKEINEFYNCFEDLNSLELNKEDAKREYHQNMIFAGIVSSIFIFCITTLVCYMILERLRKRKNKKN